MAFFKELKGCLWVKFKGLFKTPFFCFGIIAVILLVLILFGSSSSPKILSIQKNGLEIKGGALLNSLFQKEVLLPESPDLNLIQKNSLTEVSSPQILSSKALGAIVGEGLTETKSEIIEYIVQPGDNLWSLAEKFDISLDTLLWANNLKSSKITAGQKLIILPVSGVIHHVKAGDTVSEIAKTYKGKVEEVIAFNELSNEGDIFIGDILIIPGGVMPPKPPTIVQVPIGTSYFIFPTEGKITQGLHWYNAVDIANNCGTPIYAAASGTVLKVRYGWNSGAGNYLTILHPNRVVTMYGHILTSFVSPGQEVYQGQKIASMDGEPETSGSGRSTGCHLHFGVSQAENPLKNYLIGSYIKYK